MKVAILESILMPAGHEIEFDRILTEEINGLGHEACFFVPEKFKLKFEYNVPIEYLEGGEAISYAGIGPIKKIWLSMQREARRKKWFDSAFKKAQQGLCDAIIIPTSTYRYIRALLKSDLKNSPVPVIFILHGINPGEKDKFINAAEKCREFKNIHFVVLTLRDDFSKTSLPNLHLLLPPAYTPRDLHVKPQFAVHEPLRLGFFGQYRREKNLEFFLQAFKEAKFQIPVRLIIQGATAKPEDGADFDRLADAYKDLKNVTFWHKSLIGAEWQKALLDVDVILMPYAAERYRYHWGGMLFTAIGYYKPVLQSPELNPEVLQNYDIGEAVQLDSVETFSRQLENFVNSFPVKAKDYQEGLHKANEAFSPTRFVNELIKISEQKK